MEDINMFELLCHIKNYDPDKFYKALIAYRKYFLLNGNDEAVKTCDILINDAQKFIYK